MLATARRLGTGLSRAGPSDLTMTHALRRLVRDPSAVGALLMDGTRLVRSTFAGDRAAAASAIVERGEARRYAGEGG